MSKLLSQEKVESFADGILEFAEKWQEYEYPEDFSADWFMQGPWDPENLDRVIEELRSRKEYGEVVKNLFSYCPWLDWKWYTSAEIEAEGLRAEEEDTEAFTSFENFGRSLIGNAKWRRTPYTVIEIEES
jgi:hypothetical protein